MSAASPSSHANSLSPHGRFLWHELFAPDQAAAQAFYPPVTGWTLSEMPMPGGGTPYAMFMNGAQGVAGIQQPAPNSPASTKASWLPYMGTDDADATCALATSLGGSVVMAPMTIPTVGRYAILTDPEGAQFAVIAPEPASMPEVEPGVGEFAWHEMAADDDQRLFSFYQQLFGWEAQREMDIGKDGVYRMFGHGEFTYGGFMRRREGVPCAWNSYVRVADLDASFAAMTQAGGTIFAGPHEVPNDDRVLTGADDQGALISLVGKIRR